MFSNISERQIHQLRWVLSIGWLILIFSLFYDPLTPWLTYPDNTLSPLKINLTKCVMVQGNCLEEFPYPLGASIFWGIIVPSSIFVLLVFGHEFWRRICPLSFISQIPRALKLQRQKKSGNQKADKVKFELVKVPKNSWLFKNAIYLQCGLFFLGLCSRILFVNSNRLALGTFLLATIIAAIVVGYLYGGKSWCHYFCPMAPVQKIYSEPRGLLNSTAHESEQQKITQSMCRTISKDGKELSACVACINNCMDIDAERSYWENITQPDRQWLYYGYVGLVIGYFTYYYLYAGSWDYYLSGAWAHDEKQWANLLKPGFYILGQAIPIPKLVAVPLTLGLFTLGGYWLGKNIEKRYKSYLLTHKKSVDTEIIRHRIFTLCSFFIFNFFFIFAGRNFITLLPVFFQYLFPILIAVCSTLWLSRTWERSRNLYTREGLTNRLRKQLHKLKLDTNRFLEGRSLEELSTDEVYVLAKVLPGFDREKRLVIYKEILRDALDEGDVDVKQSLEKFKQMRIQLEISDQEHETIITELGKEYPDLFSPTKIHSRENLLRLASYRETLLETIFSSWHNQPDKAKIAELLKAFTGQFSLDALEDVLKTLSPEDLKTVEEIRQQYSINPVEEEDALKHTDPEQLWKVITEQLGLLENLDSEAKVLELFQKFDTDNSGYITMEELKLCIHNNVNSNVSDAQIETMFKLADTSGDQQISYEEFCQILVTIGGNR